MCVCVDGGVGLQIGSRKGVNLAAAAAAESKPHSWTSIHAYQAQ